MISPIKIALAGLQPGGAPIEIASQGMITISVSPTPEPESEDVGGGFAFMPVRWTSPRTRQDCRIEVQGCTATLRATEENIAAHIPTSEDQDWLDDWIFAQEHDARIEAEEEEARQRHYLERLRWVTEALKMRNEARAERRAFREAVASIANDLRTHKDPQEDIAAMIVGLSQQNAKMLARLQEMEERLAQAEKPKAKPAKAKK